MNQSIINLESDPVGQGRERLCYQHPDDASRLIKVSSGGVSVQSQREIDFYRRLQRRDDVAYTHIPRFYGVVATSRGRGIMVDLIRDFDGEISRSMRWYLNHGTSIQYFEPYLDELTIPDRQSRNFQPRPRARQSAVPENIRG